MKWTSKWYRCAAVAVVVLALAIPATVDAQQRSGIGLGMMLGEPTGISAVSWLGGGNALDLVAAWSFSGESSIYFHADYQFHGFVERPLTAFVGVGGALFLRENPAIGLRVPLGLTFIFQEVPLDLFFEVAPGMTLIPDTDPFVGGGVGFRFYF